MKKTGPVKTMALFLAFCMLLPAIRVNGTTAGEQLQDAQNDKKKAEQNLDSTKEQIEDLHGERVSLQSYLDKMNDELQKANAKLQEIEGIIQKKQIDISNAQDGIREAKKMQEVRYEEMKKRIKFMYEQGSESYLELFMSASSFADFLNKADYIEKINEYDRNMLAEYAQAEKDIAKKEKELEEDRTTLLVLQEQLTTETSSAYSNVEEASKNVSKFLDEIAQKEAQALAYEKEIAEKESDITVLQEQYQKELAMSLQSASLENRDLSDIAFSSEDIDLIAAIIECEAGGESYTGKVAVGAVVLNRVRSPLFPSTVLEVIMQNRQFSPVASGRFSLVLARRANDSCYQAAQDAMSGASPVGNCLFFRTPIPGLTGQQIGGHIFY